MSCNGCRSHVEKALSETEGVKNAMVDLEKAEATIEMEAHIPLNIFQEALDKDGSRYTINVPGMDTAPEKTEVKVPQGKKTGTFYCPMHCEGEKTYDKAGDCPVCGMDLVEEIQLTTATGIKYTCPMHPEINEDQPGDCPICGMDLIPKEPDTSAEEKNYLELLRKLWLSLAFTLPIFLIAMSEMIPDNPLFKVLDQKYWNWIQLLLSLPVVFYTTWMFFERAYRSIKTWNLNMFTLIGIGAGVAWVFSVFAMLLPDFFPAHGSIDHDWLHHPAWPGGEQRHFAG